MKVDKWIPLVNIDDKEIIWAGTKVRLYNVGLNVKEMEDDYYEYLVSFIFGNDDYLQLTNLTDGKAGNILCVIEKDKPNHYTLGKTLKYIVGLENTFILLD